MQLTQYSKSDFTVCFLYTYSYSVKCSVSGVNECVEATHDCHANATCNDTAFSFACVCNPGFEGNGVTCNSKFVLSVTKLQDK